MDKIKRTFILSRHTLRKPLYEMIPFSNLIQNENWYEFDDNGMQITDKGKDMQERVVEKLKEFLPNDKKIKIYANETNRTIETANIFKNILNTGDIVVEPTLFYNIDPIDTSVEVDIQEYIESIDKSRLEKAKEEIKNISLNRKLDVFTEQEDISMVSLKENGFLRFRGELATYSKISDVLMTEFYETGKGDMEYFKLIAYPKILSLNISSGRKPYCSVPISKIRDKMDSLFNGKEEDNVLIFVGHDSTMLALAHSLCIGLYPDSAIEPTPIGASLVITQDSDDNFEHYLIYPDNKGFKEIVVNRING